MKAAIVAGCVMLSVQCAPPRAHAETWHFHNYKRCTATTTFSTDSIVEEWPRPSLDHPSVRGGPSFSVLEPPNSVSVTFEQEHLAKLEAAVRFLKKCRPWSYDRNRK
jgi:hypothetical protein